MYMCQPFTYSKLNVHACMQINDSTQKEKNVLLPRKVKGRGPGDVNNNIHQSVQIRQFRNLTFPGDFKETSHQYCYMTSGFGHPLNIQTD